MTHNFAFSLCLFLCLCLLAGRRRALPPGGVKAPAHMRSRVPCPASVLCLCLSLSKQACRELVIDVAQQATSACTRKQALAPSLFDTSSTSTVERSQHARRKRIEDELVREQKLPCQVAGLIQSRDEGVFWWRLVWSAQPSITTSSLLHLHFAAATRNRDDVMTPIWPRKNLASTSGNAA